MHRSVSRRSPRLIGASLLAIAVLSACRSTDRASAAQARITLCDSLSASLAPAARTGRSVVRDTMLTDPMDDTSPWRRGCSLSLTDSGAVPGIQPHVDAFNRWFEERQWAPVLRYSADGPDGTAFAYRRAAVLCVVRGQWDGGDDADSTYVPVPGSRWMIRCAPLVAADTTD